MAREVIDIFNDGEYHLRGNGFFHGNGAGANNNMRGVLFAEAVDPASRGPPRKKRVININTRSEVADASVTAATSHARHIIPPVSSHNPLCSSGRDTLTSEFDIEIMCLKRVLDIFPDISRGYIRELYQRHRKENHASAPDVSKTAEKTAAVDPLAIVENITEDVLSNISYPKHKRKRAETAEEDAEIKWKEEFRNHKYDKEYLHTIVQILAYTFPSVPDYYIHQLIQQKESLYSAYLSLYAFENHADSQTRRPYQHLKTPRRASRETLLIMEAKRSKYGFKKQVETARSRLVREHEELQQKRKAEQAEKLNEEECRKAGALLECQCCFTDVPFNRTVPCKGEDVHFFCFTCIKNGAETQIGQMKYEMSCFDMSGCKAGFCRDKLSQALGPAIMAKLGALQQQDEISKANIEGLEDCPFCNFKAILPPIEEDREFRCYNPDCKKVSCRLCKEETHIPKTCEEAKKDKGLEGRHFVEEAMSDALIRTCSRCKVKLIKEYGCNKMICPCGSIMCYICKKDITKEGYNHFGDIINGAIRPGACKLYDQAPEARDKEEVERAERAAIQKMRSENPDLKEEDLRVGREEREREREKKKAARNRQDPAPYRNRRDPVPMPGPPVMGFPVAYAPPLVAMNPPYVPGAAPLPFGLNPFPMPVAPAPMQPMGPRMGPRMGPPFAGFMEALPPPPPAVLAALERNARLQLGGFYGPPPRRNLSVTPLGGARSIRDINHQGMNIAAAGMPPFAHPNLGNQPPLTRNRSGTRLGRR